MPFIMTLSGSSELTVSGGSQVASGQAQVWAIVEGILASGEMWEMMAKDPPTSAILKVSEMDPSEPLQFSGTASAHCNPLGNHDIY